jgi:hypothetical protein
LLIDVTKKTYFYALAHLNPITLHHQQMPLHSFFPLQLLFFSIFPYILSNNPRCFEIHGCKSGKSAWSTVNRASGSTVINYPISTTKTYLLHKVLAITINKFLPFLTERQLAFQQSRNKASFIVAAKGEFYGNK